MRLIGLFFLRMFLTCAWRDLRRSEQAKGFARRLMHLNFCLNQSVLLILPFVAPTCDIGGKA